MIRTGRTADDGLEVYFENARGDVTAPSSGKHKNGNFHQKSENLILSNHMHDVNFETLRRR